MAAGKRSAGKRAGSRPKRRFRPVLLVLALGVTASFVAWGYLVWAAIDFGSSARNGDETAWWFLLVAALGAVVCLFLALVLIARISRVVGLTGPPPSQAPDPSEDGDAPPPPPGGRRAAR
ncbi:hypothetical protein [Nocardioides litoris]|uniref:hypothetical protein n=1 Tax=Nocardioides litoris TaxID=1926648 RepID=UPI00111D5E6A|nr:hypothetical protein [Nocardioides litoris]